ncbi:MAG: flavodoxin family protein [Oscillospiraceae bacterium]|jgi:multimeric flavodoxin WrbA|nr:flavodoxin family protein [Oscillospiraceae bacterium]
MKLLILSGNPKSDGLCASLEAAVANGAKSSGAEVETLTFDRLTRCRVCKDGWGTCREEHRCAFGGDGFDAAQETVRGADVYAIVTPVYWAEVTESLKSFLDRLRRCEFMTGALQGKKVLLVASAGGSGNGILTALEQLDRFCRHTGAEIYDYIGVNRRNAEYKRDAAFAAAKQLTVDN